MRVVTFLHQQLLSAPSTPKGFLGVLLFLKNQFPVIRRHLNFVSQFKFSFRQAQGQRVENVFLHGAFERARAELRVVTVPDVGHRMNGGSAAMSKFREG
jgi:hypothetical protein